ncbi:hypothetical protein F5Y16DRAFT_422983 [Xylariaceae sp. FL0255]|nr:hypothetical protein F5Y16DRAFT_422983 [Xylariaceae sp. FL0255]
MSASSMNPAEATAAMEGITIRDSCLGGLGMVATRTIPRGSLLVSERPIFTIASQEAISVGWPFHVLENFEAMTKADQEKYLALKGDHHLLSQIDIFFLERAQKSDDKNADVCAIFLTNHTGMNEDGFAVYHLFSRINHSCSPNAASVYHQNSGQMRVYALKDLAEGDEVLISYGIDLLQPHEQRSALLKFDCKCPVCKLPDHQDSDSRRWRIKGVQNGCVKFITGQAPPDHLIPVADVSEGLQLAKENVKLFTTEGLIGSELREAWEALALLHTKAGDEASAGKCLRLANRQGQVCQGEDNPYNRYRAELGHILTKR